jgi:hypothetical protein
VIWEEDQTGAAGGRSGGLHTTFQLTDKGLARARQG